MRVAAQITYFYATGVAPVVVDDDFSRRFVRRRRVPAAVLVGSIQGDWLRPFSVHAAAAARHVATPENLTMIVGSASARGRSAVVSPAFVLDVALPVIHARARASAVSSTLSLDITSTVATGRARGAVGAASLSVHTSLLRARAVGRVNEQRLADEELLDLLVLLDAA